MINPKDLAAAGINAANPSVVKTVIDGALKNKAMDQKFQLDKANIGLKAIETALNVKKTLSECKINKENAKAKREQMKAEAETHRAQIDGTHKEHMEEIKEKYKNLREGNIRDNETKLQSVKKEEKVEMQKIKLEAGKALLKHDEQLDRQAKEHQCKMTKQEQEFILTCMERGYDPQEASELVAKNLERLGVGMQLPQSYAVSSELFLSDREKEYKHI